MIKDTNSMGNVLAFILNIVDGYVVFKFEKNKIE